MVDISELCVVLNSSVREAMQIINSATGQIALVIDEQNCLIGTLTDGDIRRGLLNGVTLDQSVDQVMNRHFRFVRSSDDKETVLEMMHKEALRQIPVLDQRGRVMQLLLLDELLKPQQLKNSVVIMAGGKGTRLWPYTEHCPKPLLPVGDKPMLEILLEQCIASGFRSFYFSVNYLKEQIIDYFDDGSRWGVSISYLLEDEPLGTAGSLQLLPDSLTNPFLVLNGDVLTRLDLRHLLRFHIEHQAQATLCARKYEITVPFGVVKAKGVELAGFEEKPTIRHHVNAGIYVIDPKLLPLLVPRQYIDMPSFLQTVQEVGQRVAVCPIHEYWLDVGQPESWKKAHATWEQSK